MVFKIQTWFFKILRAQKNKGRFAPRISEKKSRFFFFLVLYPLKLLVSRGKFFFCSSTHPLFGEGWLESGVQGGSTHFFFYARGYGLAIYFNEPSNRWILESA